MRRAHRFSHRTLGGLQCFYPGLPCKWDESAKELILKEGFSEEYGARNLERVVDRMLGTLIAEALLGGKITTGRSIRLVATDGQIEICPTCSP